MAKKDKCESPIERLMYKGLASLNLDIIDVYNPNIKSFGTAQQVKIRCGNKEYRVDFMIEVRYTKSKSLKTFIVECDGHDFHHKTKEQVTRDNKRDRDLQENGYIVLRFSGSEIHREGARECAIKVLKTIVKYSEKVGG